MTMHFFDSKKRSQNKAGASISVRSVLLFTGILVAVVAIVFPFVEKSRSYFGFNQIDPLQTQPAVVVSDTSMAALEKAVIEAPSYDLESVANGLYVPWSIVFTNPTRALISERNGSIRVMENWVLFDEPLYIFDEIDSTGEEGLMGLALDPDYTNNGYVYACLAYPKDDKIVDRVVRLTDPAAEVARSGIEPVFVSVYNNGNLEPTTIIDNIPAARFHAGCELGFGPDGKLYITTGDATDKHIAQDLDSLGGKILRINSDGSIPEDNPFPNSPIWSLGHRNPQGIDWHPVTDQLVATEHGPSVFDGPAGGDEINLIEAGANFGWPLVSHEKSQAGLVDPLLVFTPAIAPGSGAFYSGEMFPEFENDYFVGMLKGEGILRVVFSDTENEELDVAFYQKLPGIDVGRVREITQAPDGSIYFTSSNRDGRGELRDGDDSIYRLTPIEVSAE